MAIFGHDTFLSKVKILLKSFLLIHRTEARADPARWPLSGGNRGFPEACIHRGPGCAVLLSIAGSISTQAFCVNSVLSSPVWKRTPFLTHVGEFSHQEKHIVQTAGPSDWWAVAWNAAGSMFRLSSSCFWRKYFRASKALFLDTDN